MIENKLAPSAAPHPCRARATGGAGNGAQRHLKTVGSGRPNAQKQSLRGFPRRAGRATETDGRTDGRAGGRADGRTDGRTGGRTFV